LTNLLRVLVIVGAAEALVIATVYLAFTDWRAQGKVGWFLALLGGSLAWMFTLAVIGWWVRPPLTLWAVGLVAFDAALALQLRLVLRRHARRAEEDIRELE
jgi:hypothetical protein